MTLSNSEVGAIQTVVLKHARDAFHSLDRLQSEWKQLGYTACPVYERAIAEYERFEGLISELGAHIQWLTPDDGTTADSIYVRDAAIMTARGAILCRMGKDQRLNEPAAMKRKLEEIEIPVLGAISGDGRAEGGDVMWLDETTLLVGRGYRTNDEGIRQIAQLTAGMVEELVVVPLPHWGGPSDVMHLMSLISLVDHDLAVVYSKLLPVQFRQRLITRGIRLIEVSDGEFETLGCNVLAIAPQKCIMLSGNPFTRDLLVEAGVDVREYDGTEISLKGLGGPTCLARPLMRA